jgi:hypothetical protein
MSGSSDDGLIQRLQLAVWPDALGEWKWVDRCPDEGARERYVAAFNAIHEFTAKLTAPAVFSFSDDAQRLFREWMTEVQTSARSGKHPSALESHMLKMPKMSAPHRSPAGTPAPSWEPPALTPGVSATPAQGCLVLR